MTLATTKPPLPGGIGLASESGTLMYRSLIVAGALSCLPACELPTGPGLAPPPVNGEWSGTFQSSWGVLPVKGTLRNDERTSPSFSGEFRIDGQRASGTVGGSLETRDQYSGTTFWGTLTISYLTAAGEMCRSESAFLYTHGSVSEKAVFFSTEDFPKGNCPDPPTKIQITFRR
jgi:hypothetical protein